MRISISLFGLLAAWTLACSAGTTNPPAPPPPPPPGPVQPPPTGTATIQDLGPNPFTQSTTIALAMPRPAKTHLAVYDVQGRVVRTLVNRVLEAGVHPILWDGRTDTGNPVARGVYFAKLESGGVTSSRRIAVVK